MLGELGLYPFVGYGESHWDSNWGNAIDIFSWLVNGVHSKRSFIESIQTSLIVVLVKLFLYLKHATNRQHEIKIQASISIESSFLCCKSICFASTRARVVIFKAFLCCNWRATVGMFCNEINKFLVL